MIRIAWLFLAFLVCAQVQADNFQPIKDGPLHEAYVVQEFGTLLLETAPDQPPHKITEHTPSQDDPQTIWMPGYWGWSQKHGQYLWVSGAWRRPPPDHQWIPGYWKNSVDGWVWIRGFWSTLKEEELVYISHPPPDQIDEHELALPSSIGDYLWIPGYWHYDSQTQQYVWFSGRWTIPLPHWTYVPPQYIWREKGYIFNPAFWDWPLFDRGLPFSSIYIAPGDVEIIVYEPVHALQHLAVMELLFPNWPNYLCLFQYVYFLRHDTWAEWGGAPPWWDWSTWWCYTWFDAWGLWWWWSHPGYPNPYWIDTTLADTITPPPPFIEKLMAPIRPPANVTPNGVVGTKKILEAIEIISGKKTPILPSDPKQVGQIQEVAKPQAPNTPYLVPRGKTTPTTIPLKPFFGPSRESLHTPPQRVILPPVPALSTRIPQKTEELGQLEPPTASPPPPLEDAEPLPMIRPQPPQQTQPEPHVVPQQPPPRALPSYPRRTPLPPHVPQLRTHPSYRTLPAERAIPQPRRAQRHLPPEPGLEELHLPTGRPNPTDLPPSAENRVPPAPPSPQTQYDFQSKHQLPYQHPPQGYSFPRSRHQLTPMEAEHHDVFMSNPMPQVNPVGPKAYEVPGDYSTLPNE